jgi:hypothetical protein
VVLFFAAMSVCVRSITDGACSCAWMLELDIAYTDAWRGCYEAFRQDPLDRPRPGAQYV